MNKPIKLLKGGRSSWGVLKLIKGNGRINLNVPIELIEGRRQLARSGQSERPHTEGFRTDGTNMALGGLEESRALPESCMLRLPRGVLLISRILSVTSITVSKIFLDGLTRLCIGLWCCRCVVAHYFSWWCKRAHWSSKWCDVTVNLKKNGE